MSERHGGRTAGTPNKATAQVKAFLGRVFEKAFGDPRFENRLVKELIEGTLDPRLMGVLLAYYAGRPAQAVDVTHGGSVTLAQIIAGRVPKDDEPVEELTDA